jgi:ubiquinone/menaquinone biosynthesis C-methylase UbiE
MSETTPIKQVGFACPKCKRPLRSADNALYCTECNRTYPIAGGIPDFLSQGSLAPATLRIAKVMDIVAPIYESRLFASVLLKLSSVRSSGSRFIDSVASFHSESLKGITGTVLDVACGPATYSRRIASPSRNVYGIDISMGVLQQGMTYVTRDGAPGVHLARARVEELPFENAVFDGTVCSGSLHLFPDTVLSLREIARTMKPGAPLSVQTFVVGKTIINRFMQKRSWLHTFELVELQQYLAEAGFEGFQPELDGIVLTFSARKAMPRI